MTKGSWQSSQGVNGGVLVTLFDLSGTGRSIKTIDGAAQYELQ